MGTEWDILNILWVLSRSQSPGLDGPGRHETYLVCPEARHAMGLDQGLPGRGAYFFQSRASWMLLPKLTLPYPVWML
jgi:hypothetical protein